MSDNILLMAGLSLHLPFRWGPESALHHSSTAKPDSDIKNISADINVACSLGPRVQTVQIKRQHSPGVSKVP